VIASQADSNAVKPLWRRCFEFSDHLAAAGSKQCVLGHHLLSILQVVRLQNVVIVHIYNYLTYGLTEPSDASKCQTHERFPDMTPVRMPSEIPLLGKYFLRRVIH